MYTDKQRKCIYLNRDNVRGGYNIIFQRPKRMQRMYRQTTQVYAFCRDNIRGGYQHPCIHDEPSERRSITANNASVCFLQGQYTRRKSQSSFRLSLAERESQSVLQPVNHPIRITVLCDDCAIFTYKLIHLKSSHRNASVEQSLHNNQN